MSADYAQHQGDMERYLAEGAIKAYELGNRGPVRYDRNGNLHEEILAAYWQCGFYIKHEIIGNHSEVIYNKLFKFRWSYLYCKSNRYY